MGEAASYYYKMYYYNIPKMHAHEMEGASIVMNDHFHNTSGQWASILVFFNTGTVVSNFIPMCESCQLFLDYYPTCFLPIRKNNIFVRFPLNTTPRLPPVSKDLPLALYSARVRLSIQAGTRVAMKTRQMTKKASWKPKVVAWAWMTVPK